MLHTICCKQVSLGESKKFRRKQQKYYNDMDFLSTSKGDITKVHNTRKEYTLPVSHRVRNMIKRFSEFTRN